MARRIAGWWLGLGLAIGAGGVQAGAGADDRSSDETTVFLELASTIAASPDARQRLLAAYQLSSRFDESPFDPNDAVQAEARALFSAVRVGTVDPWVLWMVGTQCPFDATVCDRDGAVRQLTQLQADNAAAWLLALNEAAGKRDAAGVDNALARMAGAPAWVDYYPDTVRVALAALESAVATPSGSRLLMSAGGMDAGAPKADGEVVTLVSALGIAMGVAIPSLGPLVENCKGEALVARARKADCHKVARQLMASNTTVGQRVGAGLARRLAQDAAERAEVERFVRRLDWQAEAQMTAFLGIEARDGHTLTEADLQLVRAWTGAWRTASSESDVVATVLTAAGMPLDPPESYRSPERPESKPAGD